MRYGNRLLGVLGICLASALIGSALAQDLTVDGYSLVSKSRVSRTEFEYTYRANVTNSGLQVQSVTATLSSASPYTIVTDGELSFGVVSSGSTVTSSDTFTIRQNRRYPFSWQNMSWSIGYDPGINTRTVDPAGDILVFPNGVILDIPPNAVAHSTDIEVTDLSCDTTDPVLTSVVFQSHQKGCLGGFSAKPDGLTFAVPVTATVPVRPLEPGEIPIQVEFNFSDLGLLIAPTDLVYREVEGVLEIRNLRHFSEFWVVTLFDFVEDNCRTCETYSAIPEFCDAYAADVFRGQQSGCCLLLQRERMQCAPTCSCCMQEELRSESSGVDITPTTECQIITADLNTTFPLCPDSSTQTDTAFEMTPECGEDTILEVDMQPTALEMYACEEKNLGDIFQVTLTGRKPDGQIEFGPTSIPVRWESADENIAVVSPNEFVTALQEGQSTLAALLSLDPNMPSAQATLDVLSNISDFMVDPDHVSLVVGEERLIQAGVLAAPNRPPPDWPALDPNAVIWSPVNPSIADVRLPSGELNSVVGVDQGATSIIADFSYECETKRAATDVTVECQPVTFTVDPPTVDLLVDESHLLAATALDQNDEFLDTTGVTWSSSDETVVDLINLVGPQTAVQGLKPSSTSIPVTATYDDGCQIKEASALVRVGCVDLELSVTEGIVKVDAFLPIGVSAVDHNGNPVQIEETSINWSSSSPNTAAVIPSVGSLTNVIGIAPGTVTITAAFDEGTCGVRTATASIEVREDPTIAGVWHLSPVTQYEQCRYAGLDWWQEDPFPGFNTRISQPLGEDSDYIKATYIPDTGTFLTGSWNANTGDFNLSTDTSEDDECGYLFYWDDGADLCGDAIGCSYVSCQITTDISGSTNASVDSFDDAYSTWYYAVTFSYEGGPDSPLGFNTWECEGSATYDGERL